MIKKFALIGAALIIAAIAVFFLASYFLTSSLGGTIAMLNSTIPASGYNSVRINYANSTTIVALYTIIARPVNLYVMNQSTYSAWSGYMATHANASGISEAGRLGLGSTQMYKNETAGLIPVETNNIGKAGKSGSIYVVLDNTPGSPSSGNSINSTISYVPVKSTGILVSAAVGYGCFIAGIAGIILLIYGLIKKGKQSEEQKIEKDRSDKEYVDRLYRNVKKRKQ